MNGYQFNRSIEFCQAGVEFAEGPRKDIGGLVGDLFFMRLADYLQAKDCAHLRRIDQGAYLVMFVL